MKVLMQNCVTGRFLGKGGGWHESADKARDFGSNRNAIDYYVAHRLPDVQIVMHFDADPGLDIALPLSERCQDGHTARA